MEIDNYPDANHAYDVTSKISGFISSGINSMFFDDNSKLIYITTSGGIFIRYNTPVYAPANPIEVASYANPDQSYNLSSKGGGGTIVGGVYDSLSKVVYVVGNNGYPDYRRLYRYNTPIYDVDTSNGAYPTADTAYNISTKIPVNIYNNGFAYPMASFTFDPVNKVLYFGSGYAYNVDLYRVFLRYNTAEYTAGGSSYGAANTGYDLTVGAVAASGWYVRQTLTYLEYDSLHNVVYMRFDNGKFVRYNTTLYNSGGTSYSYNSANTYYDITTSSGFDTSTFKYNTADNVLYGPGIKRYNSTFYAGGDSNYPTSNYTYPYTAINRKFWNFTATGKSIATDTGDVYTVSSDGSKFFKWDSTTNTATDLSSKISSLVMNNVGGIVYDISNRVIYIGGGNGLSPCKFFRYNTSNYVPRGYGSYDAINTLYDISSKCPTKRVADSTPYRIASMAFDQENKVIYGGGDVNNSLFGRYNTYEYSAGGTYPLADTQYSLETKTIGGSNPKRMVYDSHGKILYIATVIDDSHNFVIGKYYSTFYNGPEANTTVDISSIIGTMRGGSGSLAIDNDKHILYVSASYVGTGYRNFVRYNLPSYNFGGHCL
jgi:hypothetical protein